MLSLAAIEEKIKRFDYGLYKKKEAEILQVIAVYEEFNDWNARTQQGVLAELEALKQTFAATKQSRYLLYAIYYTLTMKYPYQRYIANLAQELLLPVALGTIKPGQLQALYIAIDNLLRQQQLPWSTKIQELFQPFLWRYASEKTKEKMWQQQKQLKEVEIQQAAVIQLQAEVLRQQMEGLRQQIIRLKQQKEVVPQLKAGLIQQLEAAKIREKAASKRAVAAKLLEEAAKLRAKALSQQEETTRQRKEASEQLIAVEMQVDQVTILLKAAIKVRIEAVKQLKNTIAQVNSLQLVQELAPPPAKVPRTMMHAEILSYSGDFSREDLESHILQPAEAVVFSFPVMTTSSTSSTTEAQLPSLELEPSFPAAKKQCFHLA